VFDRNMQSDPFGRNTIFPSNCRGIWLAILKDDGNRGHSAIVA